MSKPYRPGIQILQEMLVWFSVAFLNQKTTIYGNDGWQQGFAECRNLPCIITMFYFIFWPCILYIQIRNFCAETPIQRITPSKTTITRVLHCVSNYQGFFNHCLVVDWWYFQGETESFLCVLRLDIFISDMSTWSNTHYILLSSTFLIVEDTTSGASNANEHV